MAAKFAWEKLARKKAALRTLCGSKHDPKPRPAEKCTKFLRAIPLPFPLEKPCECGRETGSVEYWSDSISRPFAKLLCAHCGTFLTCIKLNAAKRFERENGISPDQQPAHVGPHTASA